MSAPPAAAGEREREAAFSAIMETMLDTHAVARSLADAEFTPAQADAITNAVRLAAEHGDHVTPDQLKAGLAEVRAEIAGLDTRLSTQIAGMRTEIANLETRLIRWMVGTVVAAVGLTFGILRFLG